MVLDRYIFKTVIVGVLVATLIMLIMFVFIDFVSQLKAVGTGNYDAIHAFLFVMLKLPQRLYELSPSILLLGSIISLGSLAANSEIIVMRAAGISIGKITAMVLKTGLFVAILVAILGEYVVPHTTAMAKVLRAEAINKKLIVGGFNDIWARNENRYINVKHILPDHQLQQISIYRLDKQHHLSAITFAKKAVYKNNRWLLSGLKRTTISGVGVPNGIVETKTSFKKELLMPRLILPDLFSVLELEPQDMSIHELYTYAGYLESNKLDADDYKLAFWIKIFTPLTCLAMLLIAMPLVFTTTPRSGGAGQRIVLAVIIGVGFYVISRTTNYLGLATGVAPVISASAPLILVMVISLLFLSRIR